MEIIIIKAGHIEMTILNIFRMVRLKEVAGMLTYSFADLGSDSLYEHLYKCIKNDIINGILKVGDKLPSKRNFAKNLDISTITVENAYSQLIAEGYIYSIPKRGYFVSDISAMERNDRDIPTIKTENVELRKMEHPVNDCFADFVSNRNLPKNFPFSIWAKLTRELMSEEGAALMAIPPVGGIPELRNAIAEYMYQFRGMRVDPEQIIIGAGTEYIYGLIIQLLGSRSVFAVEEPGYKKIAKIYKSYNMEYRNVELDSQGINVKALEDSGANILHISPSHHFPTGIVTPISRRYELLGWASKSDDRYIIEDDYDWEFRLQGNPIPSLKSIDVMEKVIYINTFSKSLSSTIRISYMILPHHLLERFHSRLGFYSCTVSNFEQYTLARFISRGYFEKHINRQRNYYRTQRNTLLECINNSPLAEKVTIMEEDAGLHFLMKIDTKLSDRQLVREAEEVGLRIGCLSQYYDRPIPEVEHILVMNYSGIDTEKIPEAVKRLCILI